MIKRMIDVILSLLGLIFLAPMFIVIAILIRLDSPGPAFFRGRRVGRNGRIFYILKFRSMVADAPRKGPAITAGDDPRVTRLGRLLRQTKLDELPSLVNVLRGEMSLVGPRPESPEWVDRYTPGQRFVLEARPGITGPAQIKYRNEEALLSSADLDEAYRRILDDKLSIDLAYVQHRTLLSDLELLVETGAALVCEPRLLMQYIRRIALDLLSIPIAFLLGWFIRFDGRVPIEEWWMLVSRMVPIVCVYIAINVATGVYRRLWAYASFRDVVLLAETVGLGTLILVTVNYLLTPVFGYRLSTGGLIIGGLLTLSVSAAAKYRRQLVDAFSASWAEPTRPAEERVLIVGVNEAAQQLATQMYLGRVHGHHEVVGFVGNGADDRGMSVNGIEILGGMDQVQALVRELQIDTVVIAQTFASQEDLWHLVSVCQRTTARVKVLPDHAQVFEGSYRDPLTLRDVGIDDILGRTPARVSGEQCERILAGKTVMVTGAAGSIGSELCRQIVRYGPRLLLAVDNNETGLYELGLELNRDGHQRLELVVGDVTDQRKMDLVFARCRPEVVFHAAAYKHVPLMERHVDEAVRINLIGTIVVAEMAHRYEAERFVFISTDKAVHPSSVMGASKRVGEVFVRSMAAKSATLFTTVRFGNVIGSRGSVFPTFARQIEKGGPVTITDPEMYRYFISIPEAVSLVLQAAAFDQTGRIYMLDMGEEVSIVDLANRMIRLRGLRPSTDIEIKFAGRRPGEKLHEELSYSYEAREETAHPRVYALQCSGELADHDTLLGAILVLARLLQLPGAETCARDGIFRLAANDIDGFLDGVMAMEQPTGHRQLTEAVLSAPQSTAPQRAATMP